MNRGNNLSGLYVGMPLSLYFLDSKSKDWDNGVLFVGQFKSTYADIGLKIGFQQKLFDKGYIDLGCAFNTALFSSPQKIRPGYHWNVRPSIGIGFAL